MKTPPNSLPQVTSCASLPTDAPPLRWQHLSVLQAVQSLLLLRTGESAVLEVEQGRVWLTCAGLPDDHFLDAGQRLAVSGPARPHLSAEGTGFARLRWATYRARGKAVVTTPLMLSRGGALRAS